MVNDIAGTALSILFVILIIFISEILRKKGVCNSEGTRKFIHIGVSHWWLISIPLIRDVKFAILPPILFIILNYISYKKNLIESMERGKNKSDLGTVYFPILLLILVLLLWNNPSLGIKGKYLGAIAVLIMGYGDGFAAIIGQKYGRHKYKIFKNNKTIEGSIAMFLFSFFVSFILLSLINGFSLFIIKVSFIVSTFAALLEALTPFGMDNLSVPLVSSIILCVVIIADMEIVALLFRASIGFLGSSIIGYVAYIRKSLTVSGSIGAIILGSGIYATSGLYGGTIMILFFVSSSLLSKYKKNLKSDVAKQFDKTGNRDIFQVFANGGIGLIYSIIYYVTKDPIYLVPIGISFAASNADTWATELGVLNHGKPISLRTFKRVDNGTSGAISFLGTLSGYLGAQFIGIASVVIAYILKLDMSNYSYMIILKSVTLGGFIGCIIDSILGATLQGVYYCDSLQKETEKKIYNGEPTRFVRGIKFFNNDLVNFLSIGIASMTYLFL